MKVQHALLVFSSPVLGREDEYDEWYTGTHLQGVVDTPGFVAAQRFVFVTSKDGTPPPLSHLVIYEVEGDLMAAKNALAAGSGSRLPAPDAMAVDSTSWWYTSLSERVVSDEPA